MGTLQIILMLMATPPRVTVAIIVNSVRRIPVTQREVAQ